MSVILVTGATSGLGAYLAERLAAEHTVLVHGRDPQRTHAKARELGARAFVADLSELAQVRGLAREAGRVDVLINNAGIGYGTTREVSADGHELRLAANYLAPVLLMQTLDVTAQVLNIGSAGQEPIDLTDLMMEHSYNGMAAYRRAKLALAMATFDYAELRPDLRVNTVHPATFMDTAMVRRGGGTPQHTVAYGGENTLKVLRAGGTGQFFNEAIATGAHPDAYDLDIRSRLHAMTKRLLSAA